MGSTFKPFKLKLRSKFHELLKLLHKEFGGDFRAKDSHGKRLVFNETQINPLPSSIGLHLKWKIYLRKSMFKLDKQILFIRIETMDNMEGHGNILFEVMDKNYEMFFKNFFTGFEKELEKISRELNLKSTKFTISYKIDNNIGYMN